MTFEEIGERGRIRFFYYLSYDQEHIAITCKPDERLYLSHEYYGDHSTTWIVSEIEGLEVERWNITRVTYICWDHEGGPAGQKREMEARGDRGGFPRRKRIEP